MPDPRHSSSRGSRPRALSTSILALLALGAFSGGEARADAIAWISTDDDSFLSPVNWSGTHTPPVSGDSLVYGSSGGGPGFNYVLNNNLTSAGFEIAGITFNSGPTSYVMGDGSFTLNAGNAFTLTGGVTNNGTTVQTINNPFSMTAGRTFTTTAGGGNLLLGGNLSGAGGGILATGGGTLILAGNNSYSGGTTISAGTLQLGNGGATGSVVGNVTNHGTFLFKRGDDYTFGGVISGSGGMVQGGNILRLSAAQTCAGPTQINAGGYLMLATTVDFGLAASTVVTIDAGGNLDISNRAQIVAGLAGGGTLYSGGGSAGSLTVDVASGQTRTFSGTMGVHSPNFAFAKSGPGTQILSGTNTYTGTTTVNGGTLRSTNNGALNTTPSIAVNNAGSTLAVNYGGASDYTEAQVAALLAKTTFGSTTAAFGFDTTNATGPVTYVNALAMPAGLTKLGAGTLMLSTSNSFPGPTLINAGTLQLGSGGTTGSLSPSSAITNNGTLAFSRTDTIAQGTDFGVISGSGGVLQQGNGTVIFTGANTYIGSPPSAQARCDLATVERPVRCPRAAPSSTTARWSSTGRAPSPRARTLPMRSAALEA